MKYGLKINQLEKEGVSFTRLAIACLMANSVSQEICESESFEKVLEFIEEIFYKTEFGESLCTIVDICCDLAFGCEYGYLDETEEPSVDNLLKLNFTDIIDKIRY